MAGADRDYDGIIKGLKNAKTTLEELKKCAQMLRTEAETASAELKDNIGKQDIKDLTDLADAILGAVNPGEARVLELTRKAETEKKRFEGLSR